MFLAYPGKKFNTLHPSTVIEASMALCTAAGAKETNGHLAPAPTFNEVDVETLNKSLTDLSDEHDHVLLLKSFLRMKMEVTEVLPVIHLFQTFNFEERVYLHCFN